ncbi:cytochrome c biogenesis protein CcsA [Geobacter pickeringii]|uniref:Cytochrome c assembly protein domain-containing protein n=1 Tax=Geobacter pickeringii TaxID=345632 RepID=A0A0B5BHK1_9BACT|nr:cytochrome c biogenesis protein CcsA [Geobacter pickeringii]AJE04659.1 hypothetical protein GPICK_15925 [Geobacter pickeringii]
MNRLEGVFLLLAIGAYCVSFLGWLYLVAFHKERGQAWGFHASWVGLLFHTLAIAARWRATGHIPVMHTYENSLSGGWIMMVIYLVVQRLLPQARPFAVGVVPLALLILGNGLQVGAELQPLEPAFRSNWLFVHVVFAWFAFGSYVSAFAAGALDLLRERLPHEAAERLPEPDLLDELIMRLILFGFLSHAVMIGSGAIWAYGLWGRYWGWDPVETWSLITWLIYGLNLHLRITLGWSGRRGAWLAVWSFVGVVFLFFGYGHGSSIHTEVFSR